MTADRPRLGIVTGDRAPELSEDGQALAAALGERGVDAVPAHWRETESWDGFDALLVRSCWDYYRHAEAFDAWLEAVAAARPQAYNPPDVLRWNPHKFYLADLADAGVDTLDTVFVEQDEDRPLASVPDAEGWAEAVVKPAVGTSSEGVARVSRDAVAQARSAYEELRDTGDVLVQRFAPEIDDGERSLAFVAGGYSHASSSVPAADDFRSHHSFGGHNEPYDPPQAVVDDAAAVVQTAADLLGTDREDILYARVDGIERGGEFILMELELVEPHLGLRRADAVGRFTGAIAARVTDQQ